MMGLVVWVTKAFAYFLKLLQLLTDVAVTIIGNTHQAKFLTSVIMTVVVGNEIGFQRLQ